tara:strand:+ start:552 stop:956 length:405 start_codon:yes stop_codon:yes gene_type:complete
MATLITKLSINSTTVSSDPLTLNLSDILSIKSPSIGLSKLIIDTTGANNIIVPANDDKQTWFFVRNTGTTNGTTATTSHVDIELTGDVAIGTLKTDEWCFFPHCGNGGSTGIQLQAVSGAVEVEYAYWSDSTAQ